jgi:hypothetical protein
MSQPRMRGIETMVHPFGPGGVSSHLGIIRPLGFASPSGADIVVSLISAGLRDGH